MIAEVVATFGRHLLLRDSAGVLHSARPFGRTLEIVCGDSVQCDRQATDLLVTATLPRARLLRRSTSRGRSEPLAANITQLAIVLAPVPLPDLFLLDRYLSAAECLQVQACIVLNKTDIPEADALREALSAHAALGYDVVSVNATSDAGVLPLHEVLRDHTTIMVGQSGVGKSSLASRIASGAAEIAIGELMRDEEGRHTTTASRLYECTGGGRVIDTPGVRDFAPAIDDLDPLTLGFREVTQLAHQCRFQDCRHMREPGCAVRAAVESEEMNARRYESYRRLRRIFEDLWARRTERERAAPR